MRAWFTGYAVYLNSDKLSITMQYTQDILATAEAQPISSIGFYMCYGASYTGNFPAGVYAYGCSIVLKRDFSPVVISFSASESERPIINAYRNNAWQGWKDFTGASV